MSFVGLVLEEQASPELKRLYRRVQEKFGFLPNYFKALGSRPGAIKAHLDLQEAILEQGILPRVLKEQIGLVVSGINSASYCVAAHMELLRRLGVEEPLGRKLATDYASAPLGEKEQALFRFADKLTREPSDVEGSDIDALRQAGWDENVLLEVVLTISWFSFINRVSLGLGLFGEP